MQLRQSADVENEGLWVLLVGISSAFMCSNAHSLEKVENEKLKYMFVCKPMRQTNGGRCFPMLALSYCVILV